MKAKIIGEVSSSNELDVYQADKFARYIIKKRKWSPLKTALIATIFVILFDFLIALSARRLLPSPDYLALLADYFSWIVFLISIPTFWYFYIWLYEAPLQLHNEITENSVLRLDNNRDIKAYQILSSNRPTYIAIFFSLIIGITFYYQGTIYTKLWYSSSNLYIILHQLVLFPTYFAASSSVVRLITNTLFLEQILGEIDLKPFHPDNAGGLLPVGNYALRCIRPFVVWGFMAALLEYQVNYVQRISTAYGAHGIVLFYILFTPVVFFYPVSVAHKAMKRSRDRLISQISNQFNIDFSKVLNQLDATSNELKENADKAEQLQKIHKIISYFPVWPYDLETIRKFFITFISPVLGFLIPLILEKLI